MTSSHPIKLELFGREMGRHRRRLSQSVKSTRSNAEPFDRPLPACYVPFRFSSGLILALEKVVHSIDANIGTATVD
jgi:hypothetical protein